MISDIDKYVEFLVEHKLSEHQFLLLWLIKTKNTKSIAHYKKHKDFSISELDDLIEREWIDDFGLVRDNKRTFNIYDFIVTDKFTNAVIVDEEDAYDELKKVYPKWFNIKGTKVPAITGDPLVMAKLYFQCHKGNKLVHAKIVEITANYFKNKPPVEKMENYIKNKRWDDLEEEMGGTQSKDAFNVL